MYQHFILPDKICQIRHRCKFETVFNLKAGEIRRVAGNFKGGTGCCAKR